MHTLNISNQKLIKSIDKILEKRVVIDDSDVQRKSLTFHAGNKITIFYNDFVQKGTITSTENDTLKIKWAEFDFETKYVKFEN